LSSSIEPLFELYIFETTRLLEQLEICILDSEQTKSFDSNTFNDAIRIMHTIKGSAAMMLYTSISTVAGSLEELFCYLGEQKKEVHNYIQIGDIVFRISDYIKSELTKIEDDIEPTGNPEQYISEVNAILSRMKSEAELKSNISTYKAAKKVSNDSYKESHQELNYNEKIEINNCRINLDIINNEIKHSTKCQRTTTINEKKLDKLMDLIDEMVTAQTMVVENPDLSGLKLDNFHKAARQLQKISNELKELVISIQLTISAEYSN
jgi:chemotaxis protein histidine kinase CheA